jgi:hypothetical protein
MSRAALTTIEGEAADILTQAHSAQPGSLSVADALNRLRGLVDDGASEATAQNATERWERLGVVVEVVTDRADSGPGQQAWRAFLRQLSRDLIRWFRQSEPGTTRRPKCLWWLWSALCFDIDLGSGRLYEQLTEVLDEEATSSERQVLEDWLEAYLDDLDAKDNDQIEGLEARRRDAGFLLLRLLWDEIAPEQRLALAESTGQVFPQMSALLDIGRPDEALDVARQLEIEFMPDAVILFGEHDALDRLQALLPDADEDGLWPELACNLAGAYLELGEPHMARAWAVRAIRDNPSLEFLDFWRERAERSEDWLAIKEEVFEALTEVAPLTRLHFHLREGGFDEARQVWRRLDWEAGEDDRFQESTVRQLANMAKRAERYRLAVDIGMVSARFRMRKGDPPDLEQAERDIAESRELLEREGATDALDALNGEIERLQEVYPTLFDSEGPSGD